MSSEIKALIFDVFGSVVDWRGGVIREGEAVGRRLGIDIDWAAFADGLPGALDGKIEITLRNLTKGPLRVWNLRGEAGASPLAYLILGPKNRVICWGLPDEQRPLKWKVKPTRLLTLAAGKRTATTFKLKSPRLPPGAYRIVVVFGPISTEYMQWTEDSVWTGEATSNVVKFEVTR